MNTLKMIRGTICTPKDLEPILNKEYDRIILRFDTGVEIHDLVCYPAYAVAEKTEEILNDIKTLKTQNL